MHYGLYFIEDDWISKTKHNILILKSQVSKRIKCHGCTTVLCNVNLQ